MKNYLNFENDIKNLETELDKLKDPYNQEGLSEVDTNKISKIQSEIDDKLSEVYLNLDSWQKTQVARFEDRPKSKFFTFIYLSFIPTPLPHLSFYLRDLPLRRVSVFFPEAIYFKVLLPESFRGGCSFGAIKVVSPLKIKIILLC